MREARREGGGVERRSEAWLVQKAPPSCKWMENCDGAERAESASRARRDNETERQLEKLEKNFGSWPQDDDAATTTTSRHELWLCFQLINLQSESDCDCDSNLECDAAAGVGQRCV